MKDVAYMGVATYLPEEFEPPSDVKEKVYLEITNEADPDKATRVELERSLLEKIWDDFSPLRVPVNVVEK